MVVRDYFIPFILLNLLFLLSGLNPIDIDSNGYIMYCPCMGRFGNQADQFLGVLAFAKGLNKTLVLPPWVTYPPNSPYESLQIAFKEWFKVKPLTTYTKVITMEYFMQHISNIIWRDEERIGFCYAYRNGRNCPMKEGNPFGPFWNHFNISFTSTVEHYGLLWDTEDIKTKYDWLERFPSNKYPVLAFQGAPGFFPSLEKHQYLQKYIHFSRKIDKLSNDYIKEFMKEKIFVGIHLRNGMDFDRACQGINEHKYSTLFASSQCTGYNKERPLTFDMCLPTKENILEQVKRAVRLVNADALYIATDDDPMEDIFKKELKKSKVQVFYRREQNKVEDPIVDLAILSKANYFIGNCVSTFSAFVRRQRESRNLPSHFFGMDIPEITERTEL